MVTSKDESLLGNDILTCLDKHADEHPLLSQAAKAIRELRAVETPAPPARYLLGLDGDICGAIPCMDEHTDGDWVHWSDVKHLFSTPPKTSRDETGSPA